MNQVNMFVYDEAERAVLERKKAEQDHIEWWKRFDWSGPTVGSLCEVGVCIADTPDGGRLYCYWEQCRLIEQLPDGRWLAEIAEGIVHGEPWPKDGRRVVLSVLEIDPPRKAMRQEWLDGLEE